MSDRKESGKQLKRIGQTYKSRKNPNMFCRIMIIDISECGNIILAYCTTCDKKHEIVLEIFDKLFFLE